MPQSQRSSAGKHAGNRPNKATGEEGKLRRGRKTADRKKKQYVDPRLHKDAPKNTKPGERSFTRSARPGDKPYNKGAAKREDGSVKKSYDKPYNKSSEQKEGGENKVTHAPRKPKKAPGKKGNYGYMRTLAESSTGAKGGAFKRKHTISPGKKKNSP